MNRRLLPFGYRIRNGCVCIDEYEAVIVRRIFEIRAGGTRVSLIGKELFESGEDFFSDSVANSVKKVSAILYKSIYAGEKSFPAIVDRDLFSAVGMTKGKRSAKSSDSSNDYPERAQTKKYIYRCEPRLDEQEKNIDKLLTDGSCGMDELTDMILELAAERYALVREKEDENDE